MVAAVSSSSINCVYSYSNNTKNSSSLATASIENSYASQNDINIDIPSPNYGSDFYSGIYGIEGYKEARWGELYQSYQNSGENTLQAIDKTQDAMSNINIEEEYDGYKKYVGCSSDEEVYAIASVGAKDMDAFKTLISQTMSGPLGYIHDKDNNMLTSDTVDNIIKGSKPSDLADYFVKHSDNIEGDIEKFQDLLSKVDPEKSGLGQDYIDKLSSAMDSTLQEIKEQNGDAALEAINSSASTSSTLSSNVSDVSDVSDSSSTSNTLSFQDSYQRKIALQAYAS